MFHVPCHVACVRQVEAVWSQLHAERTRYDEEVRAAADFVRHASTLMVTHLRTSLIEVSTACYCLVVMLVLAIQL